MGKWLKRTLAGLGVIVVLLAIAAAVGWYWLRGSVPDLDGAVQVAGLDAAAEIRRDADGLVTVRAETMNDAAFAVGYAHAQDRLFQMDFMRRGGSGRLSEVVGEDVFQFDAYMRTLGLTHLAEANLARLPDEMRAGLDAYAAGGNACLDNRDGPLPPEFQILNYTPEPWRPVDTLIWGRLMSVLLSDDWQDEALRAGLSRVLDTDRIEDLWPDYPADGPVVLGALGLPRPDILAPLGATRHSASNSWVLSGGRTGTGKPILANDPHLGLQAPGHWYLTRIETPDLTLAGVTTPGVPLLVLGHNGHIAWGLTTTHGDTQDLFVEQVDPDDPTRYATPDGFAAFETREEEIAVKGGDPVTITVRSTRHGPVISDVSERAATGLADDQVVALAWPALAEDDDTAEAVYRLNRAQGWGDFLAAMEMFHSPLQTFVYADTAGHIGLTAAGRVPIRGGGNGSWPSPGWTAETDWQGMIPFAELPKAFDPPAGRLVAANNRLVGDDYPYTITAHWRDPYRAARIRQMLEEAPKVSVADTSAMQMDVVSLGAESLVPRLLEMTARDGRRDPALDLMAGWDYRMDRDAAAPLLFAAWIDALTWRIMGDELDGEFAKLSYPDVARIAGLMDSGRWCDDRNTGVVEDCATIAGLALDDALTLLVEQEGADPTTWRWGALHKFPLPHPLFSRVPILQSIVEAPVETGGGNYTVNRGNAQFEGPYSQRFRHVHGAGLRAVYDLSDLDKSRFMIATGQSGNPFSPLYGNLAPRWARGETVALPAGGSDAHVLTLTPAGN